MPTPRFPAARNWVGTGVVEAVPTTVEWDFDDGAGGYEASVTSYDIQLGTTLGDNDIDFILAETAYISGKHITFTTFDDFPIPLGQTVYIRSRAVNSTGGHGEWGYTTLFVKEPPDPPTLVTPKASAPYAYIANLDDLAIWSGSEAKPRITFDYDHPNGYAMVAYELEFAGVVSAGFLSVPSGGTGNISDTPGQPRATNVALRMRVQAVGGQWSSWTSSFNMKVNWAQGIYEHNHGAGATDFEFAHATIANPAAGSVGAFIFRKSNGTPGPWVSTVGEVTPGTHMQVLVRLTTASSIVNPSMSDMSLSWNTSPEPAPDNWQASSATIVVDPNLRRFGRRSVRVVPSGTGYVRNRLNSAAIAVTPGVEYTWSLFVHTLGTDVGQDLLLSVTDDSGDVIATADADGTTQDSSAFTDGWQRLTLTFTPAVPLVYPRISWTGTPTPFNIDSGQLEEGPRATQWRPGAAGQAVSLDVGGVQLDASLGAIFRLRGSSGGSRHVVTLSDTGLDFADVTVDSPSTGRLRVDGDLEVTGKVYGDFSGCRVYRTTTQSIADATPTAVSFSTGNATEDYDTDSYHDPASNASRLTAPVAGYYAVSAGCEFAANATGARAIYISVTDITGPTTTIGARARHINLSSADVWLSVSDIVFLDAGDYVELTVLHNAGGALNVGNTNKSTFLALARLG